MEWALLLLSLSSLLVSSEAAAVGQCRSINSITRDDQTCSVYWVCTVVGWSARNCPAGTLYNPAILRCADANTYTCPYTNSGSSSSVSNGCTATSCQNGGQCFPTLDNKGACRCAQGYSGDSCQIKDSATATTCSGISCQNGGRCFQDSQTSAQCYCPPGFMGPLCGETITNNGVCPVPQEDICNPACENGGRCFDDAGKGKCFCADGYGGEYCEKTLDPCSIITCENNGRCVENNGVGSCQCPLTHNGDRCQNEVTAECAKLNCENNAPCKTSGRSTVCDCADGFVGDRCQYENACPNVTCLNGGQCQTGANGAASCDCAVGYTGVFCEIALDCDGFTCYNGGTCKIENNQRTCECQNRTEGDQCEKKLQCGVDGIDPCQNGGKCYNSEDGFLCACPIGRTGQYCEAFRVCSDNVVCENGGTCEDTTDEGAQCNCKDGFQGPRCETAKDDCGGCQNGGVCEVPTLLPPDSAKLCSCPAYFSGNHCEIATACTIPCPVKTGVDGERYHVFVYPDILHKDHVYFCREGRTTHFKYCKDGLWFDPFAFECHTKTSFTDALQKAGDALYPNSFTTVKT